MSQRQYDREFYDSQVDVSEKSAEIIVPIVLNLVHPQSVVDLGCGTGVWLNVFWKHGVKDILGIDGDYVDPEVRRIPSTSFQPMNLQEPVKLPRRFDLAMSLEVAEHLPEQYADIFVESLTNLAPVVLFSAAIPFQGGLNHYNEQWPDYWANLFRKRDYQPVDCIRTKVWHNAEVGNCYVQNTLLYAESGYLASNSLLSSERMLTRNHPLSVVHPDRYIEKANAAEFENLELKRLLIALPGLIWRKGNRKLFDLIQRVRGTAIKG